MEVRLTGPRQRARSWEEVVFLGVPRDLLFASLVFPLLPLSQFLADRATEDQTISLLLPDTTILSASVP
jgi:hypothetical protein